MTKGEVLASRMSDTKGTKSDPLEQQVPASVSLLARLEACIQQIVASRTHGTSWLTRKDHDEMEAVMREAAAAALEVPASVTPDEALNRLRDQFLRQAQALEVGAESVLTGTHAVLAEGRAAGFRDAAAAVEAELKVAGDAPRAAAPAEPRCPHCSFDPTNMNDYCEKHRPGREAGSVPSPAHQKEEPPA